MGKTIALMAGLVAAASVMASQPAFALFDYYRTPQAPRGNDCSSASAGEWYGDVAGRQYDEFLERLTPFSARGCFRTEVECRAFLNQAMTFSGRGGIVYARCRPGGEG